MLPLGHEVRILPRGAVKVTRDVYLYNHVYYKKTGNKRYEVVPKP